METANGGGFFVNERLQAQADTVDAATHQTIHDGARQGSGSAFHRNFRSGLNLEPSSYSLKNALQFCGIEDGGRASAKVDRVHDTIELSTHLLGNPMGIFHVQTDAVHIPTENRLGKDARSEVAITTLGAAERDGNIESERHRLLSPVMNRESRIKAFSSFYLHFHQIGVLFS